MELVSVCYDSRISRNAHDEARSHSSYGSQRSQATLPPEVTHSGDPPPFDGEEPFHVRG